VIAQRTGIITVNNFRARDMAYGGQGAPLVPWVDWILLRHPKENRCIQNIGGIGNVAYLPANAQPEDVIAFDTGPGNMMMDYLVQHFTQGHQRYDAGGQWAAQGEIHAPLLTALLTDSYLQLPPPKSTGRERYGRSFVIDLLHRFPGLSEADYLATFTEFTAQSIALSYEQFLPRLPDSLWLCGGGVHNNFLKVRLQHALPSVHIGSTAQIGVDPDYKEAIAFAVLAYLHQHQLPGNLPLCTHAQQAVVLGDLHPA
jgi:anhydro-N-acetylmuramic acid kinase